MKKQYILLMLAFLMMGGIQAQDELSSLQKKRDIVGYGFHNVVDVKYHHGQFLKNTGSLDEIMDNPYDAIDIRVGFQSDGKRQMWDQLYGYPVYGVGFYSAFFKGGDLGTPVAIYMFLRAPVIRGKRWSWNWELAAGVSYDFAEYNPNTNPDQQIIGSPTNVYFNAGTGLSYQMSNRWDLTLDMDMTHFSNGSTRTPNIGVNLMGLALGGRYNFNPVQRLTKNIDPEYRPTPRAVFLKKDIEKYHRHWEVILFGSVGGKTTTTQIYDGPTYFISSASLDIAWCYHHVSKVGIGFDGFYESALRDYPAKIEDATFADLTYAGIHIAHYLRVYRLTLITQLGFYLSEHVTHKGATYIQVGGSYSITDQLFIRAALKTRNGAVADFIEWGLGYRFPFAYARK
jgi:opacity protein-like surface antigen